MVRPDSLEVKTNLFEVKFHSEAIEWYMYHIQIQPARLSRIKGENGEFLKDENGKDIKRVVLKPIKDESKKFLPIQKGSTPLTRRILATLCNNLRSKENKIFVVCIHVASTFYVIDLAVQLTFVNFFPALQTDRRGSDRLFPYASIRQL